MLAGTHRHPRACTPARVRAHTSTYAHTQALTSAHAHTYKQTSTLKKQSILIAYNPHAHRPINTHTYTKTNTREGDHHMCPLYQSPVIGMVEIPD